MSGKIHYEIKRYHPDGSFDKGEDIFTCQSCKNEYQVEGNMNTELYEEKGDTFCLTCASKPRYEKILREFYGVGLCGCCQEEFKLEQLKPHAVRRKIQLICPTCYQHRLLLNPDSQLRITKVFRLPQKNSPRPLVKADEARVY